VTSAYTIGATADLRSFRTSWASYPLCRDDHNFNVARPPTADTRPVARWTGSGARGHLNRRGRPRPTVWAVSRWALCGRLRVVKGFERVADWSWQPCVRPFNAVHMTAGHYAFRGSGPGQKLAFEMPWPMWVVPITGSTGSA